MGNGLHGESSPGQRVACSRQDCDLSEETFINIHIKLLLRIFNEESVLEVSNTKCRVCDRKMLQ